MTFILCNEQQIPPMLCDMHLTILLLLYFHCNCWFLETDAAYKHYQEIILSSAIPFILAVCYFSLYLINKFKKKLRK